MPRTQNHLQTVDASGSIGYQFPGGLTIPLVETAERSADALRSVKWTDVNGIPVAFIQGTRAPDGANTLDIVTQRGAGSASVTADVSASGNGAVFVNAQDEQSGSGYGVTLISARNNLSSFMRRGYSATFGVGRGDVWAYGAAWTPALGPPSGSFTLTKPAHVTLIGSFQNSCPLAQWTQHAVRCWLRDPGGLFRGYTYVGHGRGHSAGGHTDSVHTHGTWGNVPAGTFEYGLDIWCDVGNQNHYQSNITGIAIEA